MKKAILAASFLAYATASYAQWMEFANDLTWAEVQAKAKAIHKYVFVDIYATWCGPCKFMADSVFTKKDVGEYTNKNFICYKVQTDQTYNDRPEIRSKYAEAEEFVEKYRVTALPTMLFLSPDGELLEEQVGGLPDAKAFVERAEKVVDTHEQYFKLLEKYYSGENDSPFLTKLLALAKAVGDQKAAIEINQKLQQK